METAELADVVGLGASESNAAALIYARDLAWHVHDDKWHGTEDLKADQSVQISRWISWTDKKGKVLLHPPLGRNEARDELHWDH